MIKIDNVFFKYENSDNYVIDGLNLSIEKGEFVSLIGPNGCGKSTLARLLNGTLKAEKGNINICGSDISDEDRLWDIRKKIQIVFQNPDNQLVANVVEEEIAFGLENIRLSSGEIIKRIERTLIETDILDLKNRSTNMLSGGQKQKVAIASILAMEPEIIVFDEPTSMLDPRTRNDIFNLIRKLNKEKNITIIYITHFMLESAMSDRIIVLNSGKVEMDNKPSEIFRNIEKLKEYYLNAPSLINISYELNKIGLGSDEFILDPEILAQKIALKIKG
jgi:energy-coupling factor transport system ATP-binding protein